MGIEYREASLQAGEAETAGVASGAGAGRRRRLERAGVVLALLGAGLVAYHNSFAGVFVFDDVPHVVDNPGLRRLWPLGEFLRHAPVRPLWQLSLAANYALGGLDVRGYHAVNVAVHLLAGLVLYGLVRRTLASAPLQARYGGAATGLAAAVAALWLVHPLQTESVTYICQRAESLMGLCFLLTLYCGARGAQAARGGWVWYGAAVTASAAGMATKEVMVVAPLVMFLYDRVFLASSFREIGRRRWGLYLGLALTWGVLGVELVRLGLARLAEVRGDEHVSTWEYLRSQPGVVVHYLRLVLWPQPLVLDYQWPVARTLGAMLPAAVAVGALLAGTVWAFLWRRPALGFLGAAFFLILAPTSSILPIADLAFEHRMYLPLAPVLVALVLVGHTILRALQTWPGEPIRRWRWLGGALVVALVLLLAGTTVRRNEDYRSAIGLWRDTVAKRPLNARAHHGVGVELAAGGQIREAMAHYFEALRIKPTYIEAHTSLGNALAAEGQMAEAIAKYPEALRLNPTYASAHNNLGNVLLSQGNLDGAVIHYREALRLRPDHVNATYNLGRVLAIQGNPSAAAAQYSEALRLSPDHVGAHYHLANALAAQGKLDGAVAEYSTVLRLSPNAVAAHRNLGVALVRQGKLEEGITHFNEVLRLDPSAQAHFNLATALVMEGNLDGAIVHLREALKLDPAYEAARLTLQKLISSRSK